LGTPLNRLELDDVLHDEVATFGSPDTCSQVLEALPAIQAFGLPNWVSRDRQEEARDCGRTTAPIMRSVRISTGGQGDKQRHSEIVTEADDRSAFRKKRREASGAQS